ncbi:Protein GVQW1 [Plecturocebus cupreus]
MALHPMRMTGLKFCRSTITPITGQAQVRDPPHPYIPCPELAEMAQLAPALPLVPPAGPPHNGSLCLPTPQLIYPGLTVPGAPLAWDWLMLEMGFHHIGQAGLKLLTSGDLPASASQSAGVTGVSHYAWPLLMLTMAKEQPIAYEPPEMLHMVLTNVDSSEAAVFANCYLGTNKKNLNEKQIHLESFTKSSGFMLFGLIV